MSGSTTGTTLRDELQLIQAKALEDYETAAQAYMPKVRAKLVAVAKQGKASCRLYPSTLMNETTRAVPDTPTFKALAKILGKENVTVTLYLKDTFTPYIDVSWE